MFQTVSPRFPWARTAPAHRVLDSYRDAGIAVVIALVSAVLVVDPVSGLTQTGLVRSVPWQVAAVVAASLTLVRRRRNPELCLLAALLATLVVDARTPLIGASYAVGMYGGRRRFHVVVLGALLYGGSRFLVGSAEPPISHPLFLCYVICLDILAPLVAGRLVERQRSLRHLLQQRFDQAKSSVHHAVRFAELEQRTRLAFDIHHNVGHHATVLVLQAGALELRDELPPDVRKTAEAIQDSARAVLGELREVVNMLRAPAELDPVGRKVPCSAFLAGLVRNMAAGGMDISYAQHGEARELPVPIERAIHGVSREALTNVAKYAPTARVQVTLAFAPQQVRIEVANGPSSGPCLIDDSGGVGLQALHRDVAAACGTLEAGPRADGGFLVRATLPCPQPPAPPTADASRPLGNVSEGQ